VTADDLDGQFEAYLARDDDMFVGSQFFELMAEIERRRAHEAIEVTLRVVNGQAQLEASGEARAEGNTLWVGDKRVIVKVAE
jgi:hypothetical protein